MRKKKERLTSFACWLYKNVPITYNMDETHVAITIIPILIHMLRHFVIINTQQRISKHKEKGLIYRDTVMGKIVDFSIGVC